MLTVPTTHKSVRYRPSGGLRRCRRQLGDQAAAALEHGLRRPGVDRDRQQVALAELAAHPGEQFPFGLGLDPLGDHLDFEGPGEPDDALDEGVPPP